MRKFVKRQKLCIFTQLSIYVYEDIGCIMILNKETFEKFGYDEMSVKKFSKNVLIIKCDMCGDIFEKESIKVFAARQNSKSTKDVCFKIECIKTKRDNTMLDRYGVKNAGQSVELRQKIKKTCNEKYGGEGMASEKTRKKAIDTNIKKYGVANVFESQWCKDKMKISNIKKYGCEFSAQSDIVKDKRNHTFKNKYGVEFYTKTNEYKIKAKLTNNKKYGVDWYLQSNDKKNKTIVSNCGTSKAVDPALRSRTSTYMDKDTSVYFSKKKKKPVPRNDIVKRFHEHVRAVDINNHYCQGSINIAFERGWKTKKVKVPSPILYDYPWSLYYECISNV